MDAITREGVLYALEAVRTADARLSALLGAQEAPAPDPLAAARSFIIGPQVPLGESPWPLYDEQQAGEAAKWYDEFMQEAPGGDEYYDLALCLYQLHARSGDSVHLGMAQNVALKVWRDLATETGWTANPDPFAVSPRMAEIESMCLLLLDSIEGTVEVPVLTFTNRRNPDWSQAFTLAEWIAGFSRRHNHMWLERWDDGVDDDVHVGIRDGGMLLSHLCAAAVALPDEALRAEMLDHALTAARDYYARVQQDSGAWLWNVGSYTDATQPFQVALLLEGLCNVHRLTGDVEVRRAILEGAEAWYRDQYDQSEALPHLPGVKVRGAFYISYGGACDPPVAPSAPKCGNDIASASGPWEAGNKLKVIRQRNYAAPAAFGYCYQMTQDATWLERGDDVFSAMFGGDRGPGADGHTTVVPSDKGKTWNQLNRNNGQYLAMRR